MQVKFKREVGILPYLSPILCHGRLVLTLTLKKNWLLLKYLRVIVAEFLSKANISEKKKGKEYFRCWIQFCLFSLVH